MNKNGKKRTKRANGEGGLWYEEGRNRWRGSVVVGYNEDGSLKRKSVSGKTRAEAEANIKKIEFGLYSGKFVDKSEITIYIVARQIIEDKLNNGKNNYNTYNTNLETLKRLEPIYNTPLQKATETQIKEFLQSHTGYADNTIRKDYTLLKETFEVAKTRKIISENPMEYITKPKSKVKQVDVRALTLEEQKKLLYVLESDNNILYRNQILLAMFTGMRNSEINALTVRDINFDFNRITVNKTITKDEKNKPILGDRTKTRAGERIIPLPEELKPLLEECVKGKNKDELVFSKLGKPLSHSQINDAFKRLLKKYDIVDEDVEGKVTFHSLRHTYATRSVEASINMKALQKQLGHKDIKTTMNTYTDAFEQFKDTENEKVKSYLKNQGLTFATNNTEPEESEQSKDEAKENEKRAVN